MSGTGRSGLVCRCRRCAPRSRPESCLTHTVTHTGKRADGNNGTNRLRPHPFWTKNCRKTLCSRGWKALRQLVRMRSAVRICPAAPKSIENFGFRCFFVAKTPEMVWVNCLTHTVTHTTKCAERAKEHRRGGFAFSPVFLRPFSDYMTCAMKLPIVCAASSCFCLVAWV